METAPRRRVRRNERETMRRYPTLLLILLTAARAYGEGPSAGAAYDPPADAKTLRADTAGPLDAARLGVYLAHPRSTHVFGDLAAVQPAKALEPKAGEPLSIGTGLPLDMDPWDLFSGPLHDGPWTVHTAELRSLGARALRVSVDLTALRDDEEVYVVDIAGRRAFGPYTYADAIEGGRWLPTTECDSALLVARSSSDEMPLVHVLGLSHIHFDFADIAKALSCNINIACETDARVQQVSSAVGMLVIPGVGGGSGLCTCTLINNEDTPELEPYIITANHCVPERISAAQVDVVWDFRAATCGEDDAPAIGSLPRSDGSALLATSSALDITLLTVDRVPSGAFGRLYLGWTARALAAGEAITGIHHPRSTHMRISYGAIRATGLSGSGYRDQIEVLWDRGVTENGSSGTALLLPNQDYAIVGVLSNGPVHVCGASNNTDRFASFRAFYPQVQGYLTGNNPPDPTPDPGGACPAQEVFKNDPEMLEKLRAYRDLGLMPSGTGRKLVDVYYGLGPWMTRLVRVNPEARRAFAASAVPFAETGAELRENARASAP